MRIAPLHLEEVDDIPGPAAGGHEQYRSSVARRLGERPGRLRHNAAHLRPGGGLVAKEPPAGVGLLAAIHDNRVVTRDRGRPRSIERMRVPDVRQQLLPEREEACGEGVPVVVPRPRAETYRGTHRIPRPSHPQDRVPCARHQRVLRYELLEVSFRRHPFRVGRTREQRELDIRNRDPGLAQDLVCALDEPTHRPDGFDRAEGSVIGAQVSLAIWVRPSG